MSIQSWTSVTALGGNVLQLLGVALVAVWLLASLPPGRVAFLWLLFVAVATALVALTKLLYMAWRVGIPAIDFIGLSGHTTLSFLLWPVLFSVMLGRSTVSKLLATSVGIALAALIGFSRIQVHAHSLSEVLLGGLVGLAFAAAFLLSSQRVLPCPLPRAWLLASMLLPFFLGYGRDLHTESFLEVTARSLSGHQWVYVREDLHNPTNLPPLEGTAPERFGR